jgi:Flp pilus assembly protein CpaB
MAFGKFDEAGTETENDAETRDRNSFWLSKREFGAHTSSVTRVARLRGMVLALGLIILVLCISLMYLSQNPGLLGNSATASVPQSSAAQTASNMPAMTELLVLNHKINAGTQLRDDMFSTIKLAAESLPDTIVRATERKQIIGKFARADISAFVPFSREEVTEQVTTVPQMVEILVLNQKVSKGVQLREDMFTTLKLASDSLPAGIVRANERAALVGKFTSTDIGGFVPFSKEDTTAQSASIIPFEIPTGFRAVTITVNGRAGVEGWAKPNTVVDVLWFYREKVTRIIPSIRVLSVGGSTSTDSGSAVPNETTVTLLVSQKDAQIIELARNLGALSLSLVGDIGNKKEAGPTELGESVTIRDILRRAEEEGKGPMIDGVMEMRDPSTNQMVRYVLADGGWQPESAVKNAQENAAKKEGLNQAEKPAYPLEGPLARETAYQRARLINSETQKK